MHTERLSPGKLTQRKGVLYQHSVNFFKWLIKRKLFSLFKNKPIWPNPWPQLDFEPIPEANPQSFPQLVWTN